MSDPNSFDDVLPADAPANPQGTPPEGTEPAPIPTGIDYEVKFKESQKEAIRLLEENKEKDEAIRRLTTPPTDVIIPPDDTDAPEALFPGFEALDAEAQRNVTALVNTATKRAREEILKDPAIAHSRKVYNETKWREAFDAVASGLPDLAQNSDDFRSKYYNPNNVPDNIEDVIRDLAKIYLFDKAKEIGAEEERQRADQIDLEDVTAGDRTPTASRTLEDWDRMAKEDPTKFASLSKEFNEDMAAGRI